jgi:hypothetical protein
VRAGRRLAVAAALGAGILIGAGDRVAEPGSAEAVAALRSKISWIAPTIPASLKARTANDPQQQDRSAFVFFREGAITRQSNPNNATAAGTGPPAVGQVIASATFTDQVFLVPTSDIQNALIVVQQEAYGPQANVHVRISRPGGPAATTLTLTGTAAAPGVPAVPALRGAEPFELTITSSVPAESQRGVGVKTPTKRVFTSIVRVVETTALGTRRNLNRPLTVRTELQLNAWAVDNRRPTPTPRGAP